MLLIRRLAVDRERWLSPREFGELWAISQLSPGIHLVALAGLLGRRIAGWRGVIAAVGGMMIPASVITVALTAGYAYFAASAEARAALAGIGPVASGMTVATAALLVRSSARRAPAHLVLDLVVCAAALAAGLLAAPTIAVIGCGALVGTIALGRERPTSRDASMD